MNILSKKVYIRPVGNGIPFLKQSNAQVTRETVNERGEADKVSKPFLSSFLPETLQEARPKFVSKQGRRRYSFRGTEAELKEWVDKLKLTYPKGHRDEGKIITTASIHMYGDDFFENPALPKSLREGHAVLDPANMIDCFLFECLVDHPDFANGLDDEDVLNKKYIITDKATEEKAEFEKLSKDLAAVDTFNELVRDEDKFIKIAKILQVYSPMAKKEKMMSDMYSRYVSGEKAQARVSDDGRTRQDVFLKSCELKKTDLELRAMIKDAEADGIIREVPNRGYVFNDEQIGTTRTAVVRYFKDPANRKLLVEMKNALGFNESKQK